MVASAEGDGAVRCGEHEAADVVEGPGLSAGLVPAVRRLVDGNNARGGRHYSPTLEAQAAKFCARRKSRQEKENASVENFTL